MWAERRKNGPKIEHEFKNERMYDFDQVKKRFSILTIKLSIRVRNCRKRLGKNNYKRKMRNDQR